MIEYYNYTDKELNIILKSIVILIDSNEQVNDHVTDWFDKKKIPYKKQKLHTADYSFYIPANLELGIARDLYFNDKIQIERKAHLTELAGNFGDGRTQFEDEFRRHRGKMILLIEDSDYAGIIKHGYNSKYTPKSFLATLHSFSDRYNVPFTFIHDKAYSAQFIYCTFHYHLRNFLLHWGK